MVRLIGPREATRINVLRHLALRPFDVLHITGHGIYDYEDPSASGWVFTGGDRLTPAELTRVDRLPRFIFSNTAESGVIPNRVEERSKKCAPSFAEACLALGISNLVALAWAVDDVAAGSSPSTCTPACSGSAARAIDTSPLRLSRCTKPCAGRDWPWPPYPHASGPGRDSNTTAIHSCGSSTI